MPVTLSSLLATPEFQLRAAVPISASDLSRPLVWVHSSDLLDPTRWLEAGQLLLTDGAQFATDEGLRAADEYCQRLRRHDVAGLGFATEVIHESIPEPVRRACERRALPLVEVQHGAPFISIIRHVADVDAADKSARLFWSLEAQRAVARAAVQHDGLRAILRTLSQRLNTWVALYDASGGRVSISGLREVPAAISAQISREVRMLLDKGLPAGLRTQDSATLQTIGTGQRLRGVLAVGADVPLDPAENDVVGSVIALASIALEQQRAVDASRRRIRSGMLELFLAGQIDVATRTAEAVWGAIPSAPLLVGNVRGPVRGQSVLDELELVAAAHTDELFFAERGEEVIIVLASGALDTIAPVAQRHQLTIGLSSEVGWRELDRGLREASYAVSSERTSGLVRFDSLAEHGILGTLRAHGGAAVSRHVLAPLDALAESERDSLRDAARAWLDANTAWDPAARALGIHRHTLRARIDQLGEVLDIDLTKFAGRAELWAALEFADE